MVFQKLEPKKIFSRKKIQKNWRCADCEKEITKLSFTPTEDSPIYCKDCYTKRRT